MTDSDKTPHADKLPSPPVSTGGPLKSRRWRIRLVVAVLLLGLAGAGGWYAWQSYNQVLPPTVNLEGADPDVAAAIEAARAEVVRSPRSPAARGKLGMLLAAHRYLDAARSCFIEAARLEPEQSRWRYYHGLTLVFSDNDAAIVQFQKAVQVHAEPAMRYRLAETLVIQDRLDEAEEQYRRLLDHPALSARAQLGLGRLAFQRGDLQAARSFLDRSAAEPDTQKASHTLLAEVAQRCNDSSTAARERALVNKLPDDPDWPDPVLAEITRVKVGKDARLARALELSRENLQDAAAAFQDLVRAYPDWEQGWLNYGRFLMDHRALPAAEDAYRTVLRIAPDSVNGQFQLGVVLFQRENWLEASEHFREAVRVKPDYALAHYNLGHCLKRLNDRSGAIAAFREAIRVRPDMARARTNLGELLAEQGDKSAALEEVRLSLDLSPDDEATKRLRDRLGKRNEP
jgi:tetratricopeptide (TPR) repeat protein